MRFVILIGIFFFSIPVFSQEDGEEASKVGSIEQLEDTLMVLGYAIVNDSTPVNRFASCQKFIKTLVQALKYENSFDYPFERLKQISIQYAPDSTFRVFSWQLYVDIDDYRYFGTIQMNEPTLKMFPVIDRSAQIEDPYMDVTDADNWYGSLIYNIRSFDTDSGRKYLLWGFDGYRFFTRRKLIDVLSFEDGKPKFGAPVFEMEDSTIVNRFVLEYSAEARVKLNWNEDLGLIVFDHLVLTGSPYKGQKSMYIPDGDMDALKLEKGVWRHQRRIFNQTLDKAPRPEPVFNTNKRSEKIDLFGNKKQD